MDEPVCALSQNLLVIFFFAHSCHACPMTTHVCTHTREEEAAAEEAEEEGDLEDRRRGNYEHHIPSQLCLTAL